MPSVIRMPFSSSVDGLPIKINSTVSPATLIHTATSSTTPEAGGTWDEIWLWISLSSLFAQQLVVFEVGGNTVPDLNIRCQPRLFTTPQLVISGLLLQNSKTLRAYQSASFSGSLSVSGYVNRITN